MRHPRKAARYAGTLALLAVLGAATPARAGAVAFAPGHGVAHHAWAACDGGPFCPPAGPIYYYPTYAPAPPVRLYPTYAPAPPGFYYPAYGPPPPEGHVPPCPAGPPPCVEGPPLAAPLP